MCCHGTKLDLTCKTVICLVGRQATEWVGFPFTLMLFSIMPWAATVQADHLSFVPWQQGQSHNR